jgi:hypothetical protein
MKKIVTIIAFLALLISTADIQAQMLSESAKRKFTVGVDIYTDIWTVTKGDEFVPAGYDNRTINQGANVFFMYNMPFKPESLSGFSIGLAIRNQNSYSNSVIVNIKSTDIAFNVIEDLPYPDRTIPLSYKRSKINLTYLDLPAEVKYRTDKGFKVGIGFKVGYLIDSKQKYVGEWPVAFSFNNPEEEDVQYNAVNDKQKKINQLEKWTFGPTLRVGYKWISLFGYYQINNIFINERGPEMRPISVGLTITPF